MTKRDLEEFERGLLKHARNGRELFKRTGDRRFRDIAIAAVSRRCGPCMACCEVMAVHELEKPGNQRCVHQGAAGCSIYPNHPSSCAVFSCSWRAGFLAESDRPDLLGGFIVAMVEAEVAALRTPPGFSRWADVARVGAQLLRDRPDFDVLVVTPIFRQGDPVLGAGNVSDLVRLVALWEAVMPAVEDGRLEAHNVREGIVAPFRRGLDPTHGMAFLTGVARGVRAQEAGNSPG